MTASCTVVANTGFPLDQLLLLAAGCLAAGALALMLGRARRHGRAVGIATLLILALGVSVIAGAQAASADRCAPATGTGSALVIVQTSTNMGLAPTERATAITGRVTNRSPEDAFVGWITVEITAIVKAPHAAAGPCAPRDYALIAPAMHVGRTLHPGESADFGGAAIGFRSTAVNQDACQGAVLRLRFTSS